MTNTPVKNVPVQLDGNVPVGELGHSPFPRSYISEHKIKQIGTEKYKSSGYGIMFEDLTTSFRIKDIDVNAGAANNVNNANLMPPLDLVSNYISTC